MVAPIFPMKAGSNVVFRRSVGGFWGLVYGALSLARPNSKLLAKARKLRDAGLVRFDFLLRVELIDAEVFPAVKRWSR